ncbi:hypothetical protein BD311DRAFT_667137 [Dichomitus squalens]|uniref:Uncharacterized protein n=1 Tax=Dichomitus squalens TaxID=114155 RepID=A0A4Q9MGW6_9APHY|nr:hypothetical protein BD311DRAFT_667137 [Dichomitus squalens]
MNFKAAVAFGFVFLSLSGQAMPLVNLAKRDDNNATIPIPGFGNLNATNATALASIGFPITALSFLQASSSAVGAIVGTGTVLDLEESAAVPRVEVSSIGGPAITIATGTAPGSFQTTFAGIAFTAAPKQNHAGPGRSVSGLLLGGIAAVVGSVITGALVCQRWSLPIERRANPKKTLVGIIERSFRRATQICTEYPLRHTSSHRLIYVQDVARHNGLPRTGPVGACMRSLVTIGSRQLSHLLARLPGLSGAASYGRQ